MSGRCVLWIATRRPRLWLVPFDGKKMENRFRRAPQRINSENAAMSLLFHSWRKWRGTSEFNRYASHDHPRKSKTTAPAL